MHYVATFVENVQLFLQKKRDYLENMGKGGYVPKLAKRRYPSQSRRLGPSESLLLNIAESPRLNHAEGTKWH